MIWLLTLHLIVAVTFHFYTLTTIGHLSRELAVKDNILSISIFFLTIWCIFLVVRSYPTPVAIILYAIIIAVFFSMVSCVLDFELLRLWLSPKNPAYDVWLVQTLPLRITIYCVIYAWTATYTALNRKTESLEQKLQLQSDAATLVREAELFKLRQQLQPHFLYNSLNSISALIMIEPDKAQEMIGKLSEFLRSSVKREAKDTMPIDEELEYVQSYLAIESIRFGDRLQVEYKKDYTDDAVIPPFLLQPLLENAIKFGLYGKTGKVVITMRIQLITPMLEIKITNPYDASMQTSKGTGFGLDGINRRLYLLYGRADLLETHKDDETFTTILKIPQQHV